MYISFQVNSKLLTGGLIHYFGTVDLISMHKKIDPT